MEEKRSFIILPTLYTMMMVNNRHQVLFFLGEKKVVEFVKHYFINP